MIPLCLADKELEDDEKEKVAKVLFSQPVPTHYEKFENPILQKDLDFTREKPPSLSQLVGRNSWFILVS